MNFDLILSIITLAMVAIMVLSLLAFFVAYKRTGNGFYLMALFSAHPRVMFHNRIANIINAVSTTLYVAALLYFNLEMALIAWVASLLVLLPTFAIGYWSHREAARIRDTDDFARHATDAMGIITK